MRKYIIGIVFTLISFISFGQNIKIAYANVDYILSLMPEAQQIQAQVQAYDKELGVTFQSKYTDFETRFKEYQQREASLSQAERDTIAKNLQEMRLDLQKYQQNAPALLELRSRELLKPAYEKIYQYIEIVRKEEGYQMIFQDNASGTQILLAADPSLDISQKVLEKMGVQLSGQ